jgi:hypothetical protein
MMPTTRIRYCGKISDEYWTDSGMWTKKSKWTIMKRAKPTVKKFKTHITSIMLGSIAPSPIASELHPTVSLRGLT